MATVEELKAQLAQAEAVEGTTDESGRLFLDIQGEKFECRRVSTTWQMMKFAKAQRDAQVNIPVGLPKGPERTRLENKRNAAGMLLMTTMHETIMVLLKPHERDRFESYMEEITLSEEGLEMGVLEESIGKVLSDMAGASAGKASDSSSSLETTSESVQVISLHTDTLADKTPANA